MGTWLRDLHGYRRSYRQFIVIKELTREFRDLQLARSGAFVPDPWDDFWRLDVWDKSWKRHRRTQYRNKAQVDGR